MIERGRRRLAARIRATREGLGLTQEYCAEAIGVSRQSYGGYEKGEVEIGASYVERLAELFGVSTDYLFGRVAANPPNLLFHQWSKLTPDQQAEAEPYVLAALEHYRRFMAGRGEPADQH